jgi:hypothetical protein
MRKINYRSRVLEAIVPFLLREAAKLFLSVMVIALQIWL